jgi:hypothetical protein
VQDDPEAALREAVAALGGWEGLRATLRFEADEEARVAAMTGCDLTPEDAERLFGAVAVLRADGFDHPDTGAFHASVVVDGSPVLDLQVGRDERLFVRVDLDEAAMPADAADLGALDDLLLAARMFGLGDVAQALAEGRWIEVIGIDEVLAPADGHGSDEPGTDEQEPEALDARISAALDRFVEEDADVGFVGSEGAGARVRLTTDGASLEALIEEFTGTIDEPDEAEPLDLPGLVGASSGGTGARTAGDELEGLVEPGVLERC